MPLCAPRRVSHEGWEDIRADLGFILQVRTRNHRKQWRILLRGSRHLVAECFSEKEVVREWGFLHEENDLYFDAADCSRPTSHFHTLATSLNDFDIVDSDQHSILNQQENSAHLANVVSIMELVQMVQTKQSSFTVNQVTTMIGLLTSLSRQLVNTARSLCERHVGAAVVASQIRRIASKLDKNQNAWQEIIERAAESSPSGSGQSPVSANNSPTSIRVINAGHVRSSSLPSSPLAPATNSNTKSHTASPLSLDPLSDGVDGASISSDDTTTSSPIHPGNEGSSSQQQLLIEIIHHIDKLFELSNRVESVSHQLEGQIATFGVDEVASTDLYVSSIYYVPMIASQQKQVDTKWTTAMLELVQAGLSSEKELDGQVLDHLLHKVVHNGDSHPIGRAILQATDKYNSFLHDWQLSNAYKTLNKEEFTDKLHSLRSDLGFVCSLIAMGFKLTFPAFATSERLVVSVRRACKDIILSRLYPTLFEICKNRVKEESRQHTLDAKMLLGIPLGAESLGLRPVLFDAISGPTAMAPIEALGKQFSESRSVRQKFACLESMFTILCDTVIDHWKKSDIANHQVSDDSKYAISADDLLPILAYSLARHTPPDLHAHLLCMMELSEDIELIGKSGYVVASLQTALHVVSGLATSHRMKNAELEANGSSSTSQEPVSPTKRKSKSSSSKERSGGSAKPTDKSKSPRQPPAQTTLDPATIAAAIPADEDCWVFNEFIPFNDNDMDAEHGYNLSLKLFSLVVCIYERYSKMLVTHGKKPLYQARDAMQSDPIYRQFKVEACQLQRVNIDVLKGNEKIVFFMNVYHALLMQSLVEKEVPDSDLARLRLQNKCSYNIGGVSVSLLELEHGILRHKSSLPDLFGASIFVKRWKNRDWVKQKYAIDTSLPLISFALSSLSASGPPLRIYMAESLSQLLDFATSQYLRNAVTVDEQTGVVFLPKIMDWWKSDFGSSTVDTLQWVAQYLAGPDRDALSRLVETKKNSIKIRYLPFDWSFTFNFQPTPDEETLATGSSTNAPPY